VGTWDRTRPRMDARSVGCDESNEDEGDEEDEANSGAQPFSVRRTCCRTESIGFS
jgi:hypothetical protein